MKLEPPLLLELELDPLKEFPLLLLLLELLSKLLIVDPLEKSDDL